MSTAPLQFLLMTFAGWVNRRQQAMIDYLKEENLVLRQQLGGGRLRFTDEQRRRLAVKGRALGRRVLDAFTGLVTPDTILRWYRELIAAKYDGTVRRGAGSSPLTRSDPSLLGRRDPGWDQDPPAAGSEQELVSCNGHRKRFAPRPPARGGGAEGEGGQRRHQLCGSRREGPSILRVWHW